MGGKLYVNIFAKFQKNIKKNHEVRKIYPKNKKKNYKNLF